jgi:hypothetical protein
LIISMPRFVLLYHECPQGYDRASHWDLMLEAGGSLRTWALFELPKDWQAVQSFTASLVTICAAASEENFVGAELLGDHRREYLAYEGPLSGQRGRVTRIDAGSYRSLSESRQELKIKLNGGHLRGIVTLAAGTNNAGIGTLTLETPN